MNRYCYAATAEGEQDEVEVEAEKDEEGSNDSPPANRTRAGQALKAKSAAIRMSGLIDLKWTDRATGQ